MKAVMSEKGQVNIPKTCRDRLGLRAGTFVALKKTATDPFHKWKGKGALPHHATVTEYLNEIRE